MGVLLQINDVEVEDSAWLRKRDDCGHINVAELDAVLKGINLALKWRLRVIEIRTDLATVMSWVRSVIDGERRIRTKGTSEMIIMRRLGILRELIDEFQLELSISHVSSEKNKADKLTRVFKALFGWRFFHTQVTHKNMFKHYNMWTLLLLIMNGGASGVKNPEWLNDNQHVSKNVKHLHIGATFPMDGGWAGGLGCLPAALMAFDDVNARSDLLAGYYLNLHWNDSACEPGKGASVMYDLLYNEPTKLMLLGGCSMVAYGSSSPALSNRKRFPTFFRTHPSATVHNPTRIKLFKKFGWSRIAIIQEALELFISTVENLETQCKENGIEIVTRQSFLTDPSDAVRNLGRQNARIIVGLFYVDAARRVMCEAYKQKLYGKQFVWFLIGWYEDDWYMQMDDSVSCTPEQMKEVLEGHITTEALMLNQDDTPTISTMTSRQFLSRLDKDLKDRGFDTRRPAGYMEAPLAYDAIWALALALNKTMYSLTKRNMNLEDFTYSTSVIADEIYEAMKNTSFLGVSGHVRFSEKGDRIAWTQIEQMIDGNYNKLGMFDTHIGNFTWNNNEKFPGGKPPKDRTLIVGVYRYISLTLFAILCTISFIGIILALLLLAFNFKYSNRRLIHLSHPACNNITLVGIIFCLFSVFLLGMDNQFVYEEQFTFICQARTWILSIGFSLGFGSMFSKVWRVHRLTTKDSSDSKNFEVQSWKLYIMVGILVIIDVIILIIWQVYDPLHREIENFLLEDPKDMSENIKILPQLEHCKSQNHDIWLGSFYGYKGLVLLVGLFLAYETRSVKIRQLNDSRLVGMSIYNVVILCLITAPVSMVIDKQQDAAFAFVALAIIFCSFLSMGLIFLPKIIELMRQPRERSESRHVTDGLCSKEDEEKHQKLKYENEDLKRYINEKEDRIKILTQRLQEKKIQHYKNDISKKSDPDHLVIPSGGNPGKSPPHTLPLLQITTDPGNLLQPPGKDIITLDGVTAVTDSGYVTGLSVSMARGSRASHSDFEFSESYL
ncbi:Gamma-aminobutyric acid type B receptor subunit 1 [Nymphon striatum]|nr:Gamma-aminobutyric acid type B receptor subunit 1 [Nymphon striatum]